MTELKHGSNVAGLQTEAVLDVHKDEWVVHVSVLHWWCGGGRAGRCGVLGHRQGLPRVHTGVDCVDRFPVVKTDVKHLKGKGKGRGAGKHS